jgi:predicted MFS family arabinose efflux permease
MQEVSPEPLVSTPLAAVSDPAESAGNSRPAPLQSDVRQPRLQQGVGVTLIAVATLGLVSSEIVHQIAPTAPSDGQTPAISVFLMIMGIAFFFPSLLRDGGGTDSGVSTMRAIVLLLISVFALITLRNGWASAAFSLDQYWVWIVALAVGGKAGQTAVEQLGSRSSTKPGEGGK